MVQTAVQPPSPLAGYTPATLLGAPKGERLTLRLSAQGRPLTLVKVRGESVEHVLMKGFLWALLLPSYPSVVCEMDVGHRYKPDVVSLGDAGAPVCWGECGAVTVGKLAQLAEDFPATHFAVCKWAHSDISGHAQQLRSDLETKFEWVRERVAPFEVLTIPDNGPDEFITEDGEILITRDQLQIVDLAEPAILDGQGGPVRWHG